jgi:hypothetical protein
MGDDKETPSDYAVYNSLMLKYTEAVREEMKAEKGDLHQAAAIALNARKLQAQA